MAFSEENQLFASDFPANQDKANADRVQFTKRWDWKWIVKHQGCFCRKLAATNASSAPKHMYPQGWSSMNYVATSVLHFLVQRGLLLANQDI